MFSNSIYVGNQKETKPILRFVFFFFKSVSNGKGFLQSFQFMSLLSHFVPYHACHLSYVVVPPLIWSAFYLLWGTILLPFFSICHDLLWCVLPCHLSLLIFYVTSIIFVSFELYSFVICMISLYSACYYPFHVGTIQVCL